MAHLRFFNSEYSKVTGSIKRAQQLVTSQLNYLEEHPYLTSRNYRKLKNIEFRLEEISRLHPAHVNKNVLNDILDDLSSFIRNLQRAA